jgi:hypothetical protein
VDVAEEEPTHGELARRLDDMRAELRLMIPSLVGRAEYLADQRATDQRINTVVNRVDDVRRTHDEDMRALNDRLTADTDRATANKRSWREALWVGLLPTLVAVLMGLATVWIAIRH